jgi:MYXO-CTERM domain-containing protein
LRVNGRGRPKEAVYAQHSGAERCQWSVVERRGGHPLVYAARGSHASYLRAGVRDRMWPDPNDEARGRGRVVRPRIVRVSADSPAWMRWPGRWGHARARWWVPGEQSSPQGPAFQPDGRWSDPEGWADAARDCQAHCDRVDECDGGETALGAGGAAALVGVAAVGWRRRRRRRD